MLFLLALLVRRRRPHASTWAAIARRHNRAKGVLRGNA